MPFFARPNLDDEQFKQLSGTTLTLSGTTIFDKHDGGLTLSDELGAPIPVVILSSGRTDENVLKYVCGCITLGIVSTGGTSTGFYPYDECSTCAVGGLPVGSCLYNETIADILHDILVPTICSDITAPSSMFTATCLPTTSTGYYEMGTTVCVTGCSIFNRGCVDPAYCCVLGDGSDKRSGLPVYHCYLGWGSTEYICTTTNLNNSVSFSPRVISTPTQSVSGRVFYSVGSTVLMSDGNPQPTGGTLTFNPLPSGNTAAVTRIICGVYPYYYGKLSSGTRPAVTNSLVTGGTKVCAPVGTCVSVNFNSGSLDYTWLAIPESCTSREYWCRTALDNGCVNCSPTDKYPDECIISVTHLPWGSGLCTINYKVYMSNTYGAITTPIQFSTVCPI